MAYRNDLDALEARHKALEAEVAERTRERDEAARMLDEARAREQARYIADDYAAGGPARRRRQMFAIAGGVVASIAVIIGIAHFASRPSRAERRMQETYVQFERFTNQICACTTTACSDAVMKDMTAWSNTLAKEYRDDDPKPDEEMMKRFSVLAQRFTDCAQKLHAIERVEQNPYESQAGGESEMGMRR